MKIKSNQNWASDKNCGKTFQRGWALIGKWAAKETLRVLFSRERRKRRTRTIRKPTPKKRREAIQNRQVVRGLIY